MSSTHRQNATKLEAMVLHDTPCARYSVVAGVVCQAAVPQSSTMTRTKDLATMNQTRKSAARGKKRKADEVLRTDAEEERNDESEPETGHQQQTVAPSTYVAENGAGKQDKDKEAVEALLSLHHSHPTSAYKKLKRAASVVECAPADTDSESEVMATGTTVGANRGEVDPRSCRVTMLDLEEAEQEQASTTHTGPMLPKAVRVTSRAHLVLHQLYLRKRFGSDKRTTALCAASTEGAQPFSSTIVPNSAPLPSHATSPQLLVSPQTAAARGSAKGSSSAVVSQPLAERCLGPVSSPLPLPSPSPSVGAPSSIPALARFSPASSSSSGTLALDQLQQLMSLGAIPCLTLPPSMPLWPLLPSLSSSPIVGGSLTPILPRTC